LDQFGCISVREPRLGDSDCDIHFSLSFSKQQVMLLSSTVLDKWIGWQIELNFDVTLLRDA
jgi:hypothetical protein